VAASRDYNVDLFEALLGLRIECNAIYAFRTDKGVALRLKNEAASRLFAKHDKQIMVSRAKVEALLLELPKSQHWVDLAIFIALASGRRMIEVVKVGNFEPVDNYHVLFSGQAKMKTRDDATPYKMPILVDESVFFEAFYKLRAELEKVKFCGSLVKDLHNDKVNASLAQRLNKYVRQFLGDPDDNLNKVSRLTFKSLRAIYANMAAKRFHDTAEMSIEVFYSNLLGHGAEDVLTQTSYKGIVLDDKLLAMPWAVRFTSDDMSRSTNADNGQPSYNKLEAFDSLMVSRPLIKVHDATKLLVKQQQYITQSLLCKAKNKGGFGFNRVLVKKYLGMVGVGLGLT